MPKNLLNKTIASPTELIAAPPAGYKGSKSMGPTTDKHVGHPRSSNSGVPERLFDVSIKPKDVSKKPDLSNFNK